MPDPKIVPTYPGRLVVPRMRPALSSLPQPDRDEKSSSATAPPDRPAAERQQLQRGVDAALWWRKFGFCVIPVAPGLKRPAVAWDPWLQRLSDEAIRAHWAQFLDDDVGFIVGDRILVLDTDSAEATAALDGLQEQHGVSPGLTVSTARGEHRYFRLAEGVVVRSDSHSGKLHPERIDVKTGRSMVNLPPSGVRTVKRLSVDHADQLTEVGQAFVDAVFRHNGRPPPRPSPQREPLPVNDDVCCSKVEALLSYVDPDCGYEDWNQVLMATFHATRGSPAGLDLADGWSSRGRTYSGRREVEAKWRSYSLDVANPVTIGTLIMFAKEGGADVAQIMADAFEEVETETIGPEAQLEEAGDDEGTPLDQYSLLGRSELLMSALVAKVYVLGRLAQLGQATFFFAGPGTGKTLISLFLLLECIRLGKISGRKTYYFNMDDNPAGLLSKQELAEEYGFHMVSEGYRGFRVGLLLALLDRMAKDGSARNAIIILDTVKKFVNIMDKRECSLFMAAVRRFVMKGGTVIGLAHTNKKLGDDGKSIYAGVSDIRDDADCAYVIDPVEGGDEANERFVTFTNIKPRGDNALSATYAYTLNRDLPYADILLSVREVEADRVPRPRDAAEAPSDASVIEVIKSCVAEGFCTKVKLATEVGKRVGIGRDAAGEKIRRYSGDDPSKHHWTYARGPRGAHVFSLLGQPAAEPPEPPTG